MTSHYRVMAGQKPQINPISRRTAPRMALAGPVQRPPVSRQASTPPRDSPDKIDATLSIDPTENADANEAAEPTEKADPADSSDPADPIDRIDPDEPMDRIDP
jgi:hypothetical protein